MQRFTSLFTLAPTKALFPSESQTLVKVQIYFRVSVCLFKGVLLVLWCGIFFPCRTRVGLETATAHCSARQAARWPARQPPPPGDPGRGVGPALRNTGTPNKGEFEI